MNLTNLVNRIEFLCNQRNIKPTVACRESGAGKNFISNINSGQTPSVEKVYLLAKYFNVTIDYLLDIDTSAESEPEINHREQLLIDAYRQLNPENKVRLSERADALLDEQRRAIAQDA